jgi:calcineurin-like phosphoesterase family protein|tara:strand:+ start:162 stop:686 length:525 start_codon:yes stop_codon:yes gene_type:complete
MAKIFVISDTHFNHAGILEFKDYIGRPVRDFDSVKQMNDCMMDNWVSVVGPKDTVIHCGDVLFGLDKVDWLTANFAKLPGKKRLVLGNHDNPKHLAPFFKDIQMWIDMSDKGFLFSHTPQHASTLAESHRFGSGKVLNVHGHIHTNPSPEGPYKCVCVEQTNFTPVDIETLHAE